MKIHEYQAKELFQKFGVPIPRGKAAFSVEEAKKIGAELGVFPVVVKAQIHAGGRGKGGGVKLAKTAAEVDQYASSILGMTLVTHQTGPEGRLVKKLLVEEGLPIEKELYLSVLPDRGTAKIVFMASDAGGMDIEEVAAKTPEKIIKVYIDPLLGFKGFHANELAYGLNLTGDLIKQFSAMAAKLYKLCVEYDCSLVEINPLVLTKDGRVIALDGKINFDDNAIYRHKDIAEYRDLDEEDPAEVEASKYELNYIKMPGGNIGNMVNGAGLAMATMDIIQQAGATPANFLDVGGGASAEQVENGFRIILADPTVKGVLINIFGGILRCDRLANGVVEAAKKVGIKIPVVIRMEGTNVEEGRAILQKSGLNLITAKDVSDAAQKNRTSCKRVEGGHHMSIWVDNNTRLVVQGITGREGQFHTLTCKAYGTNVVAGVTPGKGGMSVEGIPVFNTVAKAVKETKANTAMVFVPPPFCADAILESIEAGIPLIVAITEGIPVMDMLKVKNYLKSSNSRLIGPNCPGIITPGQCKIGIQPGHIHSPGPVGIVSRSGTLTYEAVHQIQQFGIGQSTVIGIGGDPVNGTNFIDCLTAFQADPETKAIIMVGEIGGSAEEDAADFIKKNVTKPVIGFIAGLTAPPGRRMGHAGAIISGSSGTAQGKIKAMREAGITVVENLGEMGAIAVKAFASVIGKTAKK